MIGSLTVLPALLVEARRPRRARAASRSCARAGAAARRVARCGTAILDRVLRAPGGLGGRWPPRAAGRARDPGARHAHRRPGHRRAAARPAGHADLRPDPGRVPRRADPGRRRRPGQATSRTPQVAGRRSTSSSAASRPGQCHGPIDVDDQPRPARSPRSPCRSPARAPTTPPTRRWPTLRDDIVPATIGAGPRRRGLRDAADRRLEGLQRPDEVAARRSCSRSCWRWRSCCCWSRSARS